MQERGILLQILGEFWQKLTNEFVLTFQSDTQSHLATNEGVAGSNPA